MQSLIHKNMFSSKMVENLINDLMDLAKMENDKFKLFINNFDLTQAVSHTLQILLQQATTKDIAFQVKIDHEYNIPLLQNLMGDQQRVEQVFLNIVSNSLKFTPQRGKIKIYIKVQEQNLVLEKFNNDILRGSNFSDARDILNLDLIEQRDILEGKYVRVEISIVDDGQGISKEGIKCLFQDFSKLAENENQN